jgi:hypothetical protein
MDSILAMALFELDSVQFVALLMDSVLLAYVAIRFLLRVCWLVSSLVVD